MKLASIEAIIGVLENAGVRYLVAGGVAVNAYGYLRLTQDMDLVIALDRANVIRAFDALETIGYRPRVPITAEQFANTELRRSWIREKGMQVLNLTSDLHRETTVDIFVTEPFDFDAEHRSAFEGELAPGVKMRFVAIGTLIAMKQAASRPRDIDDLQHLRWILDDKSKP